MLEASFLILLLRPHHQNFGKRLIKSPKLYFLDTSLSCFLLQIQKATDLYQHAARGALFESLVLSELYKYFVHRGEIPPITFWRNLRKQPKAGAVLVYGGNEAFIRKGVTVYPWFAV